MVYETPKGTVVYFKVEDGDPALVKKLKLSEDTLEGNELKLSDRRWPAILEAVANQSITLHVFWFREPPPVTSTWYELEPRSEFKSPARPPKNTSLAYQSQGGRMIASERFMAAVKDNGLTGATFLLLDAPTPTGVERWYEVFAMQPLGRGIDHPLLDSKSYDRECHRDMSRETLAKLRYGEQRFHRALFRQGVSFADPVFRALINHPCSAKSQLFGADSPDCASFATECAPAVDFAYTGWPMNEPDDAGLLPRRRSLACTHRAREALIAAGVMTPREFTPYVMLSADTATGTVCDRAYPATLPLPAYTADEARLEHARRTAAHVDKPAAAEPRAPKTVNAMISLLQASAKQHGWKPMGATRAFGTLQQSELFAMAPANWAELFAHVPADVSDESDESPVPSCEVVQPAWNTWMVDDQDRSATTSPSRSDLVLAESGYGDWFSVRIPKDKPPRDAKVTHWDHETLIAVHTWPTVIAFAFDLMLSAEQAAASRRGS